MLDEGEQAEQRRKAIHSNFRLLATATGRLGGVPAMLDAQDCCAPGGPHEHAAIGYVLQFVLGRAAEGLRQLSCVVANQPRDWHAEGLLHECFCVSLKCPQTCFIDDSAKYI